MHVMKLLFDHRDPFMPCERASVHRVFGKQNEVMSDRNRVINEYEKVTESHSFIVAKKKRRKTDDVFFPYPEG